MANVLCWAFVSSSSSLERCTVPFSLFWSCRIVKIHTSISFPAEPVHSYVSLPECSMRNEGRQTVPTTPRCCTRWRTSNESIRGRRAACFNVWVKRYLSIALILWYSLGSAVSLSFFSWTWIVMDFGIHTIPTLLRVWNKPMKQLLSSGTLYVLRLVEYAHTYITRIICILPNSWGKTWAPQLMAHWSLWLAFIICRSLLLCALSFSNLLSYSFDVRLFRGFIISVAHFPRRLSRPRSDNYLQFDVSYYQLQFSMDHTLHFSPCLYRLV